MYTTRPKFFNRSGDCCCGHHGPAGNERGSALILALVILAVLSLIVQIISQSSTSESQIAGADRIHKETFYAADGSTEMAAELLEQNISCPAGFTNAVRGGLIAVNTLKFWYNTLDSVETPGDGGAGEGPRDFYLPSGYTPGKPHTNFTIGGVPKFVVGGAVNMENAYENLGRSAAAGGAYLLFDIAAQRVGKINSQSVVWTQYRHMIGTEGTCIP